MPYIQSVDRSGRPVGSPRYCVVELPRETFELDAIDTQRHPTEFDERSDTARMMASMEPLRRCPPRELTPPWSTPSASLEIDTILKRNTGVLPRDAVRERTAGRFHIDDATPAYSDGREYSSSAYNGYRTRQQYDQELVNSLPPLPWQGSRSLRSPGNRIPCRPVATSSRAPNAIGDVKDGVTGAGDCNRRKGPMSSVARMVKHVGRSIKRAWREKAQR